MGKEARGVWGHLSDGDCEGKLLWEFPKLIFRGARQDDVIHQDEDVPLIGARFFLLSQQAFYKSRVPS